MSTTLLTKFDLMLAQAFVFVILAVYLFYFNRQQERQGLRYFTLAAAMFALSFFSRYFLLLNISQGSFGWAIVLSSCGFIFSLYAYAFCLLIGVMNSLSLYKINLRHIAYGFGFITVCTLLQASVFIFAPDDQLMQFHMLRTVTEFALGCALLAILLVIISSQVHWSVSAVLMIACGLSSLRLFVISFTSIFLVQSSTFQRINSDMLAIDIALISLFGLGMLVWAYGIERLEVDSARNQAKYLDTYDSLTGAVKRDELFEKLPRYIEKAGNENKKVLLINVDIRHFKFVNDTYGLKAGDYVLGEVVKRVSASILKPKFVARLSGDSFAIIIESSTKSNEEEYQLNHIHSLIERPFLFKQDSIRIGASLGYARFPEHGEEAEDLLQKANLALFKAELKLLPSMCYQEGMQEKGRRLMRVRDELDKAFNEKQFELYLQPQLGLTDNKMVGAEVLIRWHHPEKGFIPPGLFLEDIEELGMSARLDKYVIKSVIELMAEWRIQGYKRIPIAINVSAVTFESEDLIEYLENQLVNAHVNPCMIELEITETTAMTNIEQGQRTLQRLNNLGLSVSIDDFGTGHSSLSYLKNLKALKIKVDRSFISQMSDSEEDRTMVKAIIDLIKGLHKHVLAEGVETDEQLRLLCDMGCDYIQGYFYAKPMPVAEFEQRLKP